jgi:predicted MFS family arabinose efflux permease
MTINRSFFHVGMKSGSLSGGIMMEPDSVKKMVPAADHLKALLSNV